MWWNKLDLALHSNVTSALDCLTIIQRMESVALLATASEVNGAAFPGEEFQTVPGALRICRRKSVKVTGHTQNI